MVEFINSRRQIDSIKSQAPPNYDNENFCKSVSDLLDREFSVEFFRENWPRRENCSFQNAMEIQLEIERKCSKLILGTRYDDVDEQCTNFTKTVSDFTFIFMVFGII